MTRRKVQSCSIILDIHKIMTLQITDCKAVQKVKHELDFPIQGGSTDTKKVADPLTST